MQCDACAKSVGARPLLWGSGEMFGRQCWISVNVALTCWFPWGHNSSPCCANSNHFYSSTSLLLRTLVNSIQESCSDSWSILSFSSNTQQHTPSLWYVRASRSVEIENPLGKDGFAALVVYRVTRPNCLMRFATCALCNGYCFEIYLVANALQSSRPSSPANGPAAASGSSISRPSSPTPPGGPRTAIRRRAAADQKEKLANARPSSTRAAGAGGSSSTMLSTCYKALSHGRFMC